MSKNVLACALSAAVLAALAVAGQRIGLALSVLLLLPIAAGVLAAPRRRPDRPALALAVLLALQPTLRDAGWVVAVTTVAALVGAAAAVAPPAAWPALARTVAAPFRPLRGGVAVLRGLADSLPGARGGAWVPVARGLVLAAALVGCFGALFASADPAFASAAGDLLDVGSDPDELARRAALAAAAAAVCGAVALHGTAVLPAGPRRRPLLLPGRTELLIALGSLVLLFVAFVAVQRPVLFGGADHVLGTSDLGYGDYARAGFLQLAVVAALTLGVVAIAARSRDRAVRLLLGVLCVLTLVVLLSAHLRLRLVEDAYGLTRVRLGGHAVVAWLAAVLCVVLAAGARPAVARRAPRAVLLLSLGAVLAFSLANPDGRIAASVVARSEAGRPVDAAYVGGLSADALHRLWTIPRSRGGAALWGPIERRLERPDGVAGFNVGRWTAR
jgi:hypothetical protein